MSIAEMALSFTGSFEAEVLLELMLRYWQHPFADDAEFRNDLLESASTILQASVQGKRHLEEVTPSSMNLISSIWVAEILALQLQSGEQDGRTQERNNWLQSVRRALPSCFCNQDNLE